MTIVAMNENGVRFLFKVKGCVGGRGELNENPGFVFCYTYLITLIVSNLHNVCGSAPVSCILVTLTLTDLHSTIISFSQCSF